MRKIVAPLALLASISLLTSCTKKEEAPAVVPVQTESQNAVMEDTNPVPPPPPAPPAPPVPPPPAPVDAMTPAVTPTESGATSPETATQPVAPISRTETVKYNTPAGGDTIEFSVTVADGVITAASAVSKGENEISKKFQEAFVPKLSESVVGKKAKELDIASIGGASLATGAFKVFVQTF